MQRRDFLKTFGAAAGGFAAWNLMGNSIPAWAAQPQAPCPNIIVFLIDDMNVDNVGCFGATHKLTPAIDRMAAEGIQFTQAYVSTTVCTPSRYSFLTGRYAGHSHSKCYADVIKGGVQGFPSFNMAIESDGTNVPTVLKSAGYYTGMVGKTHWLSELDFPEMYKGEEKSPYEPSGKQSKNAKITPELNQKFKESSEWVSRYCKKVGFDWAKHNYAGNIKPPLDYHNPEWTMEAAFEFLEQQAPKAKEGQPFYLHYTPTLTHGGGKYSKSFDFPDISGDGKFPPTPFILEHRKKIMALVKEKGVTGYDVATVWTDYQIQCFLNKVKELGIDDNTLIMFCPDHGRDSKSALYSFNGTQIPLVMRWPKGIEAGRKCDAYVQNIDMAPTWFDLAGAVPPKNYVLDGRSIRPLLEGKTPAEWRDELYFEMGILRAIQTGDGWKYIAMRRLKNDIDNIHKASLEELPRVLSPTYRLGIGTKGSNFHSDFFEEDQLYDMKADPKEQKNLAKDPQYAAKLAEMEKRLMQYLKRIGTPYGEFIPGADTAAPGQIDEELRMIHSVEIDGKKGVSVSPALAKKYPDRHKSKIVGRIGKKKGGDEEEE